MSATSIKREGDGDEGGGNDVRAGGHLITKVTRVDDPVATFDLTRKAAARDSGGQAPPDVKRMRVEGAEVAAPLLNKVAKVSVRGATNLYV